MMETNDLVQRISEIDWSKYQTAYGPANQKYIPSTNWVTSTPDLLIQLSSPDENIALKATHFLWCSICHQGMPSDAGLIATPFLLEIVANSSSIEVKSEILCIFNDWIFTITETNNEIPSWATEIMHLLTQKIPFFQEIQANAPPESDLAEFSKNIIENLTK